MQKEIWKDVKGFEGYYQISNLGRVKSLERKCVGNYGSIRTVTERILSQGQGIRNGYFSVVLAINSVNKTLTVHRLVALHFIDNPEKKPEINHKNGIKTDNYYKNLEWSTRSENEQHAYNNGLATTHSENHHSAKLKNIDIPIIRDRILSGEKLTNIANDYSVTLGVISSIKHKRKWNHIK